MSRPFDVEHRDGVTHLKLNRPEKLNSLTAEFWDDFPAAVRHADADGRTRALVVSSTGPHFTAGLDLEVVRGGGLFGDSTLERGRSRAQVRDGIRRFQDTFSSLADARFPTIAAVQGGCIGGGLGLIAACDLRYASRGAFFQLGETNLGITSDVGQLQRLPRVLPEGIVREMSFRGHRLTAERAERLGFVNELVDDKDLVEHSVAVAQEIASRSPLAVWGAKTAIDYARDHTVADGLDQIALWQAAMYHRTDSGEALTARNENRSPEFADLPTRTDGR